MKVGVIGAGTMGSGIGQAFAQAGYEVCLCDIKQEFADGGKNKIAAKLNKLVAKGKMEQADADAILGRITTGLKDICTDCDLVIEVAPENMKIKKDTFQELMGIVKPECMFATNTSSLSITEIGAGAFEQHEILNNLGNYQSIETIESGAFRHTNINLNLNTMTNLKNVGIGAFQIALKLILVILEDLIQLV